MRQMAGKVGPRRPLRPGSRKPAAKTSCRVRRLRSHRTSRPVWPRPAWRGRTRSLRPGTGCPPVEERNKADCSSCQGTARTKALTLTARTKALLPCLPSLAPGANCSHQLGRGPPPLTRAVSVYWTPEGTRYTMIPWVIGWFMKGRSYGALVPRKLRERGMNGGVRDPVESQSLSVLTGKRPSAHPYGLPAGHASCTN